MDKYLYWDEYDYTPLLFAEGYRGSKPFCLSTYLYYTIPVLEESGTYYPDNYSYYCYDGEENSDSAV
jgi:hypothetical protein